MPKSELRPSYKIVIVGADGSKRDGPLIQVPPAKRRRARKLNDDQWTESEAIARFKRYLFRQDAQGLTAAVQALDRLDCWTQATRHLNLNRPTERHAQILVSFWIEHGLSSIPMGLRDNLPEFIDALKRFLEPYQGPSVTLYRGELEARYRERKYGIAWTANLKTAEMFARRRSPLGQGPGVVLKAEATPDVIVADLKLLSSHAANSDEHEYLVDPRLIHEIISIVG